MHRRAENPQAKLASLLGKNVSGRADMALSRCSSGEVWTDLLYSLVRYLRRCCSNQSLLWCCSNQSLLWCNQEPGMTCPFAVMTNNLLTTHQIQASVMYIPLYFTPYNYSKEQGKGSHSLEHLCKYGQYWPGLQLLFPRATSRLRRQGSALLKPSTYPQMSVEKVPVTAGPHIGQAVWEALEPWGIMVSAATRPGAQGMSLTKVQTKVRRGGEGGDHRPGQRHHCGRCCLRCRLRCTAPLRASSSRSRLLQML